MEKIPPEIMKLIDEMKKYIEEHEAFIVHVKTEVEWKKKILKKLEEIYEM